MSRRFATLETEETTCVHGKQYILVHPIRSIMDIVLIHGLCNAISVWDTLIVSEITLLVRILNNYIEVIFGWQSTLL